MGRYSTERPAPVARDVRVRRTVRAGPAGTDPAIVDSLAAVAAGRPTSTHRPDLRLAGVQRWVDRHGQIRPAGFGYWVLIVLASEPVEAVVADHLVQIFHHDALVASHVKRRKSDTMPAVLRQGRRNPRAATTSIVVARIVNGSGQVSFAGTMDRAGRAWQGKEVEVCIVAGSVQMSCAGTIVRTPPIRHDRAKEHGAYGYPARPAPQAAHDAPHL